MPAVTDLSDYLWCQRYLWLKKKLGIKWVNQRARLGTSFHVLVHGIYEQIKKSLAMDVPGKVIATELVLPKRASPEVVYGLAGRLDVLRKVTDGYIIQDEKYSPPPMDERIHPSHKIQLDAYAFLVEKEGYAPVKSAVIVYEDMLPREIEPTPERVPDYIHKVNELLLNDILPKKGERCSYCAFSPLCTILPDDGGLSANEILRLKEPRAPLTHTVIARHPSRSQPGTFYSVKRSSDGTISCDCPGWKNRRRCWHTEKAKGTT